MTDALAAERRPSPVPADWTYAPAPESRDVVRSRSATASSSAASGSSRAPASTFTTISPRDEEPLAEVAQAGAEDVELAVAAAREAFGTWSALPGSERAKYLFRIARILQERAREFAVLESLNGGKPIKESRDVDLPLAAAHFFYYAGWADKLEYAFPNRTPRPLGVAGQIIPWNFPLLMLAWKLAPALAAGQHRRAQAGRDDAAHGAALLRRRPPGRAAAGRRQHRHRRRPHRRRARRRRGRQDRVHRLDRGRQGDPAAARRHRQEADARARRQGREHRLRRRRARPGGRGDRQRHLLQPGPRLLRRLAALRPGVDRRAADREAEAAHGDAARRRPARQEHRRRRDQLAARSSRRSRSSSRPAREEGAEIYQPPCRLPEKGYWFAPTVFTNVAQSYRIAQEEIFGPVLSRAHVPHARGGDREGEQHAVRPLGRRLDGEGLAHPLDGGAAARRRRLGEHVQPLRPDEPVRRLQGVRLRPRGRPARARAVPRVRRLDGAVEIRPRGRADEEALAALDRATWSSLSSPAPPPGRAGRSSTTRSRPGGRARRGRRRRGRRLRPARPGTPLAVERATC